jgi:CSLREA domain-containing protein
VKPLLLVLLPIGLVGLILASTTAERLTPVDLQRPAKALAAGEVICPGLRPVGTQSHCPGSPTPSPPPNVCTDPQPPAPAGYVTAIFEDFCDFDPAQWVIAHDSSWDYQQQKFFLTGLGPDQAGRLYFNSIHKTERFRAEFDYEIYGGSEAEGLTFVFTGYPHYGPQPGGLLDYCDAGGWAVEFDTYANEWWDPPERHVGVLDGCAYNHLATVSYETRGSHHVVIEFDLGYLTVAIDGTEVISYTISNFLSFSGLEGYFGLSAATGDQDDYHVIDNLHVSIGTPDAIVNSTADAGDADLGDAICQTSVLGECTLRAAIEQANHAPDVDLIHFQIPTSDPGYNTTATHWTIGPGTALPVITEALVLDATTQSGWNSFPHRPRIEFNGSALATGDGLAVTGGNTLIRGFAINRFPGNGIRLTSDGNLVQATFIGTDPPGSMVLGNSGDGILISDASGNAIGGPFEMYRNRIAGNARGVFIEGAAATGNAVRLTNIRSNEGLGIDLAPAGFTPNDLGDTDTGANGLQNYPTVISALNDDRQGTYLSGTLHARPFTTYEVGAYVSENCDPSGNGEGVRFLQGSSGHRTDSNGNVGFSSILFNFQIPLGHYITLTATDEEGSTSEFSECHKVQADSDEDRIANQGDNCLNDKNPDQIDSDLDGLGDACDVEDDGDGYSYSVEGGMPLCDGRESETALNFGDDGVVDDGCPGSPPKAGRYSEAAFKIGTGLTDPCGTGGWPSDLVSTGASANRLDIVDLGSFIAPVRRLNTNPDDSGFNSRWDLKPGRSDFGAVEFINLEDLAAVITGTSGYPPMLGGQRAFGKTCPSPP